MSLQQYKLNQKQQDLLSDACNPKGYLAQGAIGTFDVQARCADAWATIGAQLKFDPATVQAIQGKGVSCVMATPKP